MKKIKIAVALLLIFIIVNFITSNLAKRKTNEKSLERASAYNTPSLCLSFEDINKGTSFALYYDKTTLPKTDTLSIIKNMAKNIDNIPVLILDKDNAESKIVLDFNYDIDEEKCIYTIPTQILLKNNLIIDNVSSNILSDNTISIMPNHLYLIITSIDSEINNIFTFLTYE